MTDQELIDLVLQKSPEDLAPEEVDLLRARLAESAELREVLVGQLKLDSYLASALGPATVTVDDILIRARREQTAGSNPAQAFVIIVSSLLLLILVVGVFVAAWMARPDARKLPVAAKSLNEKPNEEGQTPVEGETSVKPSGPSVAESGITPTAGTLPLAIEAESFVRGNVKVDNSEWGTADLAVIRTDANPAFAEYELILPEAAKLALRMRYASFDSRPLRLSVNGIPQPQQVAGEQTGGHAPSAQKWFTAGEYEFQKGKNVIRLETPALFPHLDQLVIAIPETNTPSTGVKPTTLAEKAAPWREVLDRPGDPPAFADLCYENFRTDKSLPQRDDLHRWFAPVDGQRYRVYDNRTRLGQCAAFEGLIRLKAPWKNDSALKLALEGYDRLQIHFFSGLEGVSLINYESENFRWGAYATTRKANSPKPDKFVIAATDETRNRRSEIRFGGAFEIRHRDGEIVLSRGDVVLLRVPFAKPPQEVYFDGKASFHGIAFLRTLDFPPPAPAYAITTEIARPADLTWVNKLKRSARVETTADGAIELRADNAEERGWIAAPIEKLGMQEVVFALEDASPGASVYLGRKEGEPNEMLRFMRNQRDGGLCLATRHYYEDAREGDYAAPAEKVVPVTTGKVWLKLLSGGGTLRWWLSTDGVNWGQPTYPIDSPGNGYTHIGLHHVARAPDCRIRLKRVELHELTGLPGLASKELRAMAPALHMAPNYGDWLAQATAAKPADVEAGEWRRACAVNSLAAGCVRELGWKLVEALLDDAAARNLPLDQQLKLLDEAVLLCDMRWGEVATPSLFARYPQVGLAAFDQHGVRPFTAIRHPLMSAPFYNELNLNVRQICEPAIRTELIQLLSTAQWDETLRFCERLRFFKQEDQLPLVEWAEFTARRNSPVRTGADSIGRQREEWRHPYTEQLNKETYNLLAELTAILDSDAYPDAARMITSLDANALSGVAPQGKDRDLFVSLPAAVKLALRQHPGLETLLKEKFGPLAQLRIRTAIAENNVAAVQLAAVQFEATEAAAEAHRWLGDRALSSGWFTRALAEYRRAETTAEASVREELAHRVRLAAAMLGEDAGQPITREVRFGDTRMAPAEFESLVAEMKKRAGKIDRAAVSPGLSFAPAAPVPTGYSVERRGRLEAPFGDSPGSEVTRGTNRYKVDWAGRQLATAVEGEVMYMNNRFQVAAYELGGQLKWRGQPPPGKIMRSQDFALTAMRPLVTPRHVIVRQLYGTGPILTCYNRENGHFVWSSEQRQNEFLVSDPVLVQDQLVCLTLARQDQRDSLLRLTVYDIESGEPLSQHPLVEVRESWWLRKYCEVVPLDDALVASLGGLVVCADLSGNLRWARRQVTLPAEEESTWVLQNFDRPLLHERRLYIAQPGVRSVECLDPDTGSRHWSVVLPTVQRLVGIADGRLIVQTERDLRAYDLASGAKLWTHEATDLLNAQACGGAGGILYCRRDLVEPEKKVYRPRFVWLDPTTGLTRASTPIAGLEDADPRLGPLVSHRDRLFTFFGKGQADATRDIIELVPKGEAEKPVATDKPDVWTRK